MRQPAVWALTAPGWMMKAKRRLLPDGKPDALYQCSVNITSHGARIYEKIPPFAKWRNERDEAQMAKILRTLRFLRLEFNGLNAKLYLY
jgi:hypothetical protein